MEELKTSADTAVMYGAHYLFSKLLPRPLYRYLINLVNRNSSLYLSNIQGPTPGPLSIGSHRLRKAFYFLSPPSYCAITYNVLSLNDRLYLSISSKAKLLPNARELSKHFGQQVELLAQLLARRRVPGESKRARAQICARHPPQQGLAVAGGHPSPADGQALSMHQYYDQGAYYPQLDHHHPHPMPHPHARSLLPDLVRNTPLPPPPPAARHIHLSPVGEDGSHHQLIIDHGLYEGANLSDKLHEIQDELNRLSQAYEMHEPGVVAHYELLKSQFTSLLHEMRRRKSIADYGQGILINIEVRFLFLLVFPSLFNPFITSQQNEDDEDDENDGELRPPPRRFSVVSIGRRGSIVPNIPVPPRVTPPILNRRARGVDCEAHSGATPSSASPEPPSSPDMFKSETEC